MSFLRRVGLLAGWVAEVKLWEGGGASVSQPCWSSGAGVRRTTGFLDIYMFLGMRMNIRICDPLEDALLWLLVPGGVVTLASC